ncbi:hypothetical protein HDU81_000991 [Chytriomyces hyalinus]|nr:hypothetical protein HDU81_000991 [Chytriomyces hyalinus]
MDGTHQLEPQDPCMSLLSLPRELLEQILVHHPIDDYICEVALSSKALSQILLNDLAFSRTHFDKRICLEEGGTKGLHLALDPVLNSLPLTYLAVVFQSVLEGHDQLLHDWTLGSSWRAVSQPVAEKLVAHLSPILEKQAVPQLLQWMYESQYPSSVAALMILASNQDLPLTNIEIHRFMVHAVTCGWNDVVQILMAVDRRVDLSFMDCQIVNCINSLEMAQVILLDERFLNGQFLLSVLRGDMDAVEYRLEEKDWNPTEPNDLSIKFATDMNHPEILEAILADERVQLKTETQNHCIKSAVEREMWRVFDVLKAYARQTYLYPDGTEGHHRALDPILDTLPMTYRAIVFQSVLENHEGLYPQGWTHGSSWCAVPQPVGEKLVARVAPILEKQALPNFLQWMCASQYSSSVAALTILANNQDLPLSNIAVHLFMVHAVTSGWNEVVQTLMDRGFEVSNHENHALEAAAEQDNCEMVAILLQDCLVNLAYLDCRIMEHIKSLEMAQVLLADERFPNGPFLLSVMHGDIEAVKSRHKEKDWDPTAPNDMGLKYAIDMNRPEIVEALLSDERVQLSTEGHNLLINLAVEREMWGVVDVLKAYTSAV